MENENEVVQEIKKENNLPPITSIIIVVALMVGAFIYTTRFDRPETSRLSATQEEILQNGVELPVKWGNLGVQMIEAGVIDKVQFENLYSGRGGLSPLDKKLLESADNGNLVITSENSGVILNMLWAFGLGNKNAILENGPMMDPRYGGAGNFASTGGWTLAKGKAMDHYSVHSFITLTPEQQVLVEQVAKNIYRPCCGNSTYFPDCNHGMAMLGLLELMASQGVSEMDMYKAALVVNSYWFPDTYETIKIYMKSKGVEWKDVNPQEILGANYSSGQGFAQIASQVTQPVQKGESGGCGVDAGIPTSLPKRQQGGCGVDAGQPAIVPQKQQGGCGI